MKDYTSAIGILRGLTIISGFIITLYVFSKHKNWTRFSQGFKPLLYGAVVLLAFIIINCLEKNCLNIDNVLPLLTLYDSGDFGLSRLISLAYIVILYGIEISLIVLVKNIKQRRGKE